MQPLDAQSALQVYGEASGWPMHTGSLQIYDPATSPEPLDVERVRLLFQERLPHLPVFRQRLLHSPGLLGRPVWVEDHDVDVHEHLQPVTLDAPGSDEQLGALAGRLMERPLDHGRPLWDGWVVDGLSGGRAAVLLRTHHALMDGVRGMQVQAAMFDTQPDSPLARPGSIPGPGAAAPSRLQMLGASVGHLAGAPARLARTAGRLASSAGQAAALAARGQSFGASIPQRVPRTQFNRAITHRRAVAFCSVPLQPVKDLAHQEGGTVNDVVLTLVGGALRRYLAAREALPRQPLVAAIPIGLTSDADESGLGNRWQVMTATLATDQPEPLDRLHAISAATRAEKARYRAIGPDVWADAVDIPPFVISAAAMSYARLGLVRLLPPPNNVTVSNVRGAPFPLYLAGARLVANYPLGPLADGMALNVTVIGYERNLDFGVQVCPDLVPDCWELAGAIREEADGLPRYLLGS
jgi:WS/DGAT/MGAT family acyltransferase